MPSWLSRRLSQPDLLVVPGAYDAFTARLVDASAAEAVYCGGFATVASAFGLPDIGLVGLADMESVYRRVCAVVGKPVIADADTGYGGPLNVQRTVDVLARAGVGAVHIEDQVDPKRCGHLSGKRVVDATAAQARVAAAVEAAGADGPAIIARTDALGPLGMDAVVDRLARFERAGAHAVFVDAVRTVEELRAVRAATSLPVVWNAASTGVGPALSHDTLTDLGIDMVIYPIELLMASMAAAATMMDELLGNASVRPPVSFAELTAALDLPAYVDRDKRLGS